MDGSFSLAVHALVYLSHKGGSVSSEELARNICTNAARVRRDMAGLKKAGLIETHEGQDGGYCLRADAGTLTLQQVAQAVQATFVGCTWHSGDTNLECAISSGMADVMDELYQRLNEQCGSFLSEITIADIERKLFYTDRR